MNSKHAAIRCQQRGIPPWISELLDRFGIVEYAGHGAERIYFNKLSIRAMERELGKRVVAKLEEWLDVFKIVSSDGVTCTVAHKTSRFWRY